MGILKKNLGFQISKNFLFLAFVSTLATFSLSHSGEVQAQNSQETLIDFNTPFDFSFISTPDLDAHNLTNGRPYVLTKIIVEPQANEVHELVLFLNDASDIDSVVRKSSKESFEFRVPDLRKGDVVLAVSDGRKAVLLSCANCAENSGGLLTLKFLNNGITNYYKTMNLKLVRNGNDWSLMSEDNKIKINTLRLHSRKILGQVIGIDRVTLND